MTYEEYKDTIVNFYVKEINDILAHGKNCIGGSWMCEKLLLDTIHKCPIHMLSDVVDRIKSDERWKGYFAESQ